MQLMNYKFIRNAKYGVQNTTQSTCYLLLVNNVSVDAAIFKAHNDAFHIQ